MDYLIHCILVFTNLLLYNYNYLICKSLRGNNDMINEVVEKCVNRVFESNVN